MYGNSDDHGFYVPVPGSVDPPVLTRRQTIVKELHSHVGLPALPKGLPTSDVPILGKGGGISPTLEMYSGAPRRIGANGIDDGSEYVTRSSHRATRAVAATALALVLAFMAGTVIALFLSSHNFYFSVGSDHVQSSFLGAITTISLGATNPTGSCSATFISRSGTLVTATHCLQDPMTADGVACTFDGSTIPLSAGPRFAQVHNVNGTGEIWIIELEMVGWSGVTDVTVMRTKTLTVEGGGDIDLVAQPFLRWGDSRSLSRGEDIMGLTYSANFVKFLTHRGAVQSPDEECTDGAAFCTGTERLHVDTQVAGGASGSSFVDRNGKIVMAPLTWRFTADSDGVSYSSAGTTQRIAQPLANRFQTTAANGAGKQFLVPTLGINPVGALGLVTLTGAFGGSSAFTFTQIRGYLFDSLLDQSAYDFFQFLTDIFCIPAAPLAHVATAPSLLGAPRDAVEWGTPPDPFPVLTGADTYVLKAIERTLDRGDFEDVGEHPGLETVSGMLIAGGKWAGDVIRVRIRRFDPSDTVDPTKNWQAIYRVTLKAIDPYLDTLVPSFALLTSEYVVDLEQHPPAVYAVPDTILATPLLRSARPIVVHPPPGVDCSVLPTLHQCFIDYLGEVHGTPTALKDPTKAIPPGSTPVKKKPTRDEIIALIKKRARMLRDARDSKFTTRAGR